MSIIISIFNDIAETAAVFAVLAVLVLTDVFAKQNNNI